MSAVGSVTADSRQLGQIRETIPFRNPLIRFRKIRGRIVPIVNKHKLGNMVSKKSKQTAKAGAYVTAGTVLAKGTHIRHHLRPLVVSKKDAWIKRSGKKVINFAGRHSGKIGLGLIASGAAGLIYAERLKADSHIGASYL